VETNPHAFLTLVLDESERSFLGNCCFTFH